MSGNENYVRFLGPKNERSSDSALFYKSPCNLRQYNNTSTSICGEKGMYRRSFEASAKST